MKPRTVRADAIPAAWFNNGTHIAIHAYDGPALTGRLDSGYIRKGRVMLALTVATTDGDAHRVVVGVAPDTLVEVGEARS